MDFLATKSDFLFLKINSGFVATFLDKKAHILNKPFLKKKSFFLLKLFSKKFVLNQI